MTPRRGRRSRSRSVALQGLYQWQITRDSPSEIAREFRADERTHEVDESHFDLLLCGVPAQVADLDARLLPALDRPLEQLDPVELSILRIGTFELLNCPDVPWRVVVNEAIDLAHIFGADQSHKYVNGILDRLARSIRPQETGAKSAHKA